MSSLVEGFVALDKENHDRMKGAIETAISADFKVEEAPKHDSGVVFSKKPLDFFVREKIDPASFAKTEPSALTPPSPPKSSETEGSKSEDVPNVPDATGSDVPSQGSELDDVAEILVEDTVQSVQTDEIDTEASGVSDESANEGQSELYDEGFAAGRAAALSELEEQRLEHLDVLKSISEKLLTDSVFDFNNISKKVIDTVNELSSERCGLAIDENPEGFVKRIAAQMEQVRNLSEERRVFFNEEDLAALKSFDEFENYFSKAQVHVDQTLKRGDVIVKVGGVELRDTPFRGDEQDAQDE